MPLVDPATGESSTAPLSGEKDIDNAYAAAAAEGIATAGYFNAGQGPHGGDARWRAPPRRNHIRQTRRRRGRLVPPVNNVNQTERVLSFFENMPSHAKVAVGAQRQGDKGFYVQPTVIIGLKQDDRLIQNEIFGPVITVQSFSAE